MIQITRPKIFLAAGLTLVLTAGCQLFGGPLPDVKVTSTPATSSPVVATQAPYTPPSGGAGPAATTSPPEGTQPPDETSADASGAQDRQPCAEQTCLRDGTFWLERPIGPEGRNSIVTARRFGEYQPAAKYALRGVYFLNSSGTPVLAAAAGEVVVAGRDNQAPSGPFVNYYGNLVILKHQLPGLSQTLYSLYGHLSEISVEVGDTVSAGQEIGLVGMSGTATGSTLLFEVRLGENDFHQARNPELWLKPHAAEDGQPRGALAGRILDADGNFVEIDNIVVEQLAGPGQPAVDQLYLKTYSAESLLGLDPWEESFAAGDLPAADYQISFLYGGIHQMVATVQPGKLTLVTFVIE